MSSLVWRRASAPMEMHDLLKSWGQDIAKAREALDLSRVEFAACLFLSEQTITLAEKGDPKVSLGVFISVLWALGLIDDLEGPVVSVDATAFLRFEKPSVTAPAITAPDRIQALSLQLRSRAMKVLRARGLEQKHATWFSSLVGEVAESGPKKARQKQDKAERRPRNLKRRSTPGSTSQSMK